MCPSLLILIAGFLKVSRFSIDYIERFITARVQFIVNKVGVFDIEIIVRVNPFGFFGVNIFD
jgi:hypothetical protein